MELRSLEQKCVASQANWPGWARTKRIPKPETGKFEKTFSGPYSMHNLSAVKEFAPITDIFDAAPLP
jgi:hypothetical protein